MSVRDIDRPRPTRYKTHQTQFGALVADLGYGLAMWRLWTSLAWEDLQARYKRSYIGLLWNTIAFGFFIFVKFIIFGSIATVDDNYYLMYLTIGFFAWLFLSAGVTDACGVWINSENWIKGARIPLTVFVMRTLVRTVIISGYNFLIVALIGLVFGWKADPIAWMAIPAFLLYCVNAFFLSFLFGSISTRHRDFMHLVSTIMRVMFFLTPILWLPEQIGDLWKYLQYNPFAQLIDILRAPLLDKDPPTFGYIYVGIMTAILAVTSMSVAVFTRRKIVYWL